MKLIIVLMLGSSFIFASALPSPDEKEFEGWMKSTSASIGSLRKNLEGQHNEEAVKDANNLTEVFKKVETFWQTRKTEDAVKWSQQAQAAAGELSAAAKAGDYEKAAVSLKALTGTCAACHTAHREKLPEGGYKIK